MVTHIALLHRLYCMVITVSYQQINMDIWIKFVFSVFTILYCCVFIYYENRTQGTLKTNKKNKEQSTTG